MTNEVKKEVEKSLTILGEEIAERQEQIELIKNIDFSKPIDEETWHKICETPLRSSDILAVLVKNTFPLATNIVVHCNYVYFEISGFSIQIPTSRAIGINVSLDWYERNKKKPTAIYHNESTYIMKKYFEAVDRKAGWYELAKLRIRHRGKLDLFIKWWFKYKWKPVHREQWEEVFAVDEKNYEARVKLYYAKQKLMRTKCEMLVNVILPIIDEFSTVHRAYNQSGLTIADLRNYENI